MAKTQRDMKQRTARRDVDTHAALALARAYSETRNSIASSRSPKPKVERSRPELRVVQRPRRRVGFRISNRVFAAYFIGFLALFAAIVMRAEMAATQLQLNSLNSRVASMRTQHQTLEIQLAALEAPGRVVSYAETHLGMVYPAQVGYLGVANQGAVTQGPTIALTQKVLSSPNTLFAPAGEAGSSIASPPVSSQSVSSSKAKSG